MNPPKGMASDGGNLLEAARSQLEAKAEELMESIKSAGSSAVEQGEEVLRRTEEKISEKPLTSVLVTLGVGVALGWLLRRKMS